MLVNISPCIPDRIEAVRLKKVAKELGLDYNKHYPASYSEYQIEKGVYCMYLDIKKCNETKVFTWEQVYKFKKGVTYGVADNLEQVKDYFKVEIQHPLTQYVITIDRVSGKGKDYGTESKCGKYIGEHNLDCSDYLKLVLFQIYKIS